MIPGPSTLTTLNLPSDESSYFKRSGRLVLRTARPGGRPRLGFAARGGGLGTIHLTVAKGGRFGGSGGTLRSTSPDGPAATLTLHTRAVAALQRETLQLRLSGVQLAGSPCLRAAASIGLARRSRSGLAGLSPGA
jgi:hypothetical protein